MTTEERKELKKKIIEEITKVEKDIVDLTEQSKPIAPENAIGRISRMDAINNKAVSEASLRKSITKLNNLQVALSKVDTAGFGICTRCGKPIQAGRLMYMPESTRCIHCADRF